MSVNFEATATRTTDPPAESPNRLLQVGLAAVLLLHGVLCWLARPPGILVGQDDVEYIALGQSLRHGGYSLLFRVDNVVHAQYPPAYPAMLGAWGAVFGDSFNSLVLISVLMSVALIGVTWLGVRRIAGPGLALLVAVALSVNTEMVRVGSVIASEAPYAFLSILVLYLLLLPNRSRSRLVLICSLAILTALTRSIGVVLAGAVGVVFLFERRWKTLAIYGVAVAAFVGGWLVWTVVAPEHFLGMSYIADLQASVPRASTSFAVARRVWRTILYYATDGVPWVLGMPTIPGTIIDNLVGMAVLYIGLLGGFLVFVRRWRAAAIYLLFYFGLLAMWRFRFDRFAIPTATLLVAGVVVGWSYLLTRAPVAARRLVLALVVMILVVGGTRRTREVVTDAIPCRPVDGWPPEQCLPPASRGYFNALRYIRASVPEDAVFLTAKSGALWYYTGRKSVSYGGALAQDTAGFLPYLRSSGAGWVLLADLEQSESRGLLLRLDHACAELTLAATFAPRTYLFRLSDSAIGTEGCEALREFRSRLPRNRDEQSSP